MVMERGWTFISIFIWRVRFSRLIRAFIQFPRRIRTFILGVPFLPRIPFLRLKVPFLPRIPFFSLGVPFLDGIQLKREEENVESLQVITLRRAICISDDPATLLHATANILSISSPGAMTQLWHDSAFQDRFFQLVGNPSNGMAQLRGYNGDPKDLAESARRLYYCAAAHIALNRVDFDWARTVDVEQGRVVGVTIQEAFRTLLGPAAYSDLITILIPSPLLQNSSSNLIRSNLGLCILWCSLRGWDDRAPEKDIDSVHVRNHLTACSEALASCPDLRLLSFLVWIVPRFPRRMILKLQDVFEQTGEPYMGNAVDAMEPIRGAFMTWLSSESAESWDSLARDTVLTNMLRCVERIVADAQGNSDVNIYHKFKLLEFCEAILRTPQLPEAAGPVGRKLRVKFAQIWSREYINRAGTEDHLVHLKSYIANLRNLDRSEFGYHEDIAVAQVSGTMLREIFSHTTAWWDRQELASICEMFNTFVSDVHKASRQFQNNSRRVRDPDERWCHWQEEPLSIEPVSIRIPYTEDSILLLLLSSPTESQNNRSS